MPRHRQQAKIQINNKFTYGDAVSASVTDIPDNTSAKKSHTQAREFTFRRRKLRKKRRKLHRDC
ncbi:MAG: hypothetical protein L6V93_15155 [Clostridiales bacterium]|nr:MAG: hypothetical protein L6V93_15155 [Clostridiales bacterium]